MYPRYIIVTEQTTLSPNVFFNLHFYQHIHTGAHTLPPSILSSFLPFFFLSFFTTYYLSTTVDPDRPTSETSSSTGRAGVIVIMPTTYRSRSSLRQRSMERSNKLTKSMSAAASRNTSPSPSPSRGAANRRVAKLDLYLQRSARNSKEKLHHRVDADSGTSKSTHVRRWDGNRRMTLKWDSLRRVSGRGIDLERIHLLTAYRIPSFGFLTGIA